MSFTSKSLSALALTVGLMGAAYAQDTTTTPNTTAKPDVKTEKHQGHRHGDRAGKFEGRGFGGRFGRKFGGGEGRFGSFGRGITLTDDQKAQIKQIREANKPDPALFQELRTIMEARRNGSLTDAQKARAKEIREQFEAKHKSVRDQIDNVLTAEQKAQIKKNMADRKARREQMRQHREEWRKNHQNKPDTKAPGTTTPSKPITE